MYKSSLIASSVFLFVLALPVQADVLSIAEPTYRTPNSAEGVIRPTRGMTMDQVQAKFGVATEKRAAIGDPPITRWEYEKWSVYFEYKVVLFTVLHKGAVIDKKTE